MTYDVPQWLLRVQRLQQELEQARLERDSARAGESSWRQRYQEELRQYQVEAEQARQRIAALEAQRGQSAKLELPGPINLLSLKAELAQCQSVEELKAKLAEALQCYETPPVQDETIPEVAPSLNPVTGPARSLTMDSFLSQ